MTSTVSDGIGQPPGRIARARLTRRQIVAASAGLIGLSAAATGVYAAAIEPFRLVVTRYALNPPGWPADRKLSMTVVADLHAGGPDMLLPHIRQVIDTANSLQSDIVVVLGDFKAWYHSYEGEPVADADWSAEIGRLAAPLGVWTILGNHDWWHDQAGVRAALANVRIPVLENNAVLLGSGTKRFWLAGVADQIAHRLGWNRFRGEDDLPGTLARINTDDPVVLLVHEPDIFVRVPRRVSITLAGHTHGGQVRLPLIGPPFVPSDFGQRFAYGHIVEDNRHMIVSGGLGTSIFPVRFGVPPEIVHLTLGA